MKVLIIDDERRARSVLRTLLNENCTGITQILEAENLLTGVKIIKKERPKLVFLDIEMPEHSGLEIVDFIDRTSHSFEIIFVTAHNDYAIQAFKLSAVDYLLKPARPTQLKQAVIKAQQQVNNNELVIKLQELKYSFDNKLLKKIALPFTDGVKFINFSDIILFEADAMYTKVSTINTETLLVSKPLKHFVELLSYQSVFYRPHRSFLINLNYVKAYIKRDGGYIIMDNDKIVSISNDKKEDFLNKISKF